ncbi:MAG: ribonuclease Z [Candidatus Methanomethylicia archaeon]
MIRIVFLGTSAGIPTSKRGLPAIAIKIHGDLILLDCGEGSQRQMMTAKIRFGSLKRILITHLHGDHVFGLPGLLHTFSLMNREENLEIYGPPGLAELINCFVNTSQLTYRINIIELKNGEVLDFKNYRVITKTTDHTLTNYAYAIIEREKPGKFHPEKAQLLGIPRGPLWRKLQQGDKVELPDGRIINPWEVVDKPRSGLKIVYTGDTAKFDGLISFSREADVLIHEATFENSMIKKATEEKHSTAAQAAEIAREAKVKLLVLTHISPRYDCYENHYNEAAKIFSNTMVAEDFKTISLS